MSVSRTIKTITQSVASERFFYVIIAITILQALWYILSFQPTIYDEGQHLSFITLYSHQLSPFITHQSTQWDVVGEAVREPSYLFYYALSWPLRIIRFFSGNAIIQVTALRLICTASFVWGLFLYRKVLAQATSSKAVVHAVLFFFILTPTVALYPGTIHYDDAIFPLYGLLLLLALRIMRQRSPNLKSMTGMLIVCFLGSIVYFPFVALWVPIFLYVFYKVWLQNKKQPGQYFRKLRLSLSRLSTPAKLALAAGLLVSLGLFLERPVWNVIKFHQINPDCQMIIGEQRCMTNYITARNLHLQEVRPSNFHPLTPFEYVTELWIPNMVEGQIKFLPGVFALPIMSFLYYVFALGGLALVFVYLRNLLKNKIHRFLLLATMSYLVLLMTYQYYGYVKFAGAVALIGRYLIEVMPLFMVLVALSLRKLLSRYRTALVVVFVVITLLFTQGGSITTYLLSPNERLQWNNPIVTSVNSFLKRIAHKTILERPIL